MAKAEARKKKQELEQRKREKEEKRLKNLEDGIEAEESSEEEKNSQQQAEPNAGDEDDSESSESLAEGLAETKKRRGNKNKERENFGINTMNDIHTDSPLKRLKLDDAVKKILMFKDMQKTIH